MFKAILNVVLMPCKIILLILPICDLKGLIDLQVGLLCKSLLWSLNVIKPLFILYFSILLSTLGFLANIHASLFNTSKFR